VLLDLMMPRMSGFEVISTLRGRGQLHDLPIIVLTAKDLDDPDYEMLNGTRAIFRKGSLDVFVLAGRICEALSAA
jgi:CheY-like chemotaxis protein